MEKKKAFYGWVVVAACFILTMFPMVFVSNTFSYYQYPICGELGVSYVEFNVASVCSTVASMAFSFLLAGRLARGNMRRWILVGGIVVSASVFAQSLVTSMWQLDVVFFLTNFALSTLTYIPINTLISNWFVEKKALATSIAFVGSNIGGVIFTPVVSRLIEQQGWRFSFQVSAVVVLVSVIVVSILVRKSPAEMGQEALGKNGGDAAAKTASGDAYGLTKAEAMKTGAFWLLIATVLCCGMLSAGIMTQVPTYLIENAVDYALVMSVYSGVSILAKPVMGVLYDKIGLFKGIMLNALLGAAALGLLILAPGSGSFAVVSVSVLSFGLAVGTLAPPLIVGRLFGSKDYGAIYGMVNIGFMAGCMIGPMLSSAIRTVTGSYGAAWIAYIVIFAVLAVFTKLALNAGSALQEKVAR